MNPESVFLGNSFCKSIVPATSFSYKKAQNLRLYLNHNIFHMPGSSCVLFNYAINDFSISICYTGYTNSKEGVHIALTNEDLLAISQLLDVKISSAFQSELQPIRDDIRDLRADMNAEFSNVYAEFNNVYAEFNNVYAKFDNVNAKFDSVNAKFDNINAKFDNIYAEFNNVYAEFNNVYAKFDNIKAEFSNVYAELNTINTRVQAINLHLENTTDKNIQLLAENYVPAAKRYEKAVPEIQAMQADIDIMKKVLAEHSEILKKFA
ncbi:MAG: hypothetical protein K2N44_02325 [Lachnospiraceae bacterium]|nr:hypothetical protein [Lachnospiraceae bacterium]